MNKKQIRTLERIARPDALPTSWRDIESLFEALGAVVDKSSGGSMVCVSLNDHIRVFHRPHPGDEAHTGIVRNVRKYLKNTGVL